MQGKMTLPANAYKIFVFDDVYPLSAANAVLIKTYGFRRNVHSISFQSSQRGHGIKPCKVANNAIEPHQVNVSAQILLAQFSA